MNRFERAADRHEPVPVLIFGAGAHRLRHRLPEQLLAGASSET
jgi:hypothetical protein